MTEINSIFSKDIVDTIQKVMKEGIENAAKGYSGMVGKSLNIKKPSAKIVKLLDINKMLGGPEDETVAIYLRAEGSIPGQMMLVMKIENAMGLVDQIMGQPIGTTESLGSMERSALQELGNITGTFFLNSVADITKSKVIPSPPAVMVDMVAAILDIVIATAGYDQEEVLLIQAEFDQGNQIAEMQFWVIPDPSVLKEFQNK